MGSVNVQPPTSLNLSNVEKDSSVPSPPPTPTNGLIRNLSVTSLRRTNSTERKEQKPDVINIETPNPSHLYWVPAEQHPEIAPAEFNHWLKEHAYSSDRRPRIRRRRSVLSVSYTPEDIEAEEDPVPETDHQRDSVEETLAILERPAEPKPQPEANQEEEPDTSRRDRIRRSLSLNLPIISEQSDHINVFDRNSSPHDESRVLVPRADSSLLRRGARTKIRRNSTMDSTSGSSNDSIVDRYPRKRSRDFSGGHVSDPSRLGMVPPGGISLQDTPLIRVDDTSLIGVDDTPLIPVDDIKEEPATATIVKSTTPPPPSNKNRVAGPRTSSLPSAAMRDALAAKLAADSQPSAATSSSIPSHIPIAKDTPAPKTNENLMPKPPSPARSTSTGRKSTWSRIFRTDDSNKMKRNKPEPSPKPEVLEEPPAEAVLSPSPPTTRSPLPIPSESIVSASGRKFGSLSSLFSRSSVRPAGTKIETTSPKASSKVMAKKLPPPLPKRLPIHVERAVYRLSHIKLANPRRPLQHQVLISNFMFWYLSIVDAGHHSGGGGGEPDEADNNDKKGKKINKLVAAGKKRRQEIIQNKQRKAQLAHERMGGRRSELVIPTVQYDKQVRHHQLPHVAPRGSLMTPQQYIGPASAPTGFVVPQQYLHPATKASSDGESDDDEAEEEEEDEEDEDVDNNVQWPLPPRVATEENRSSLEVKQSLELKSADLGTFGSELIDMIKFDERQQGEEEEEEEDDVPLALYRKSH